MFGTCHCIHIHTVVALNYYFGGGTLVICVICTYYIPTNSLHLMLLFNVEFTYFIEHKGATTTVKKKHLQRNLLTTKLELDRNVTDFCCLGHCHFKCYWRGSHCENIDRYISRPCCWYSRFKR